MGTLVQEEENAGEKHLEDCMVRRGSIVSLLGWELFDHFLSNVYLPKPQKLPEEKEPFVINSFVKNPIFLQKRSDENFLVICTLGLTSPLFAQAGLIYFAL